MKVCVCPAPEELRQLLDGRLSDPDQTRLVDTAGDRRRDVVHVQRAADHNSPQVEGPGLRRHDDAEPVGGTLVRTGQVDRGRFRARARDIDPGQSAGRSANHSKAGCMQACSTIHGR